MNGPEQRAVARVRRVLVEPLAEESRFRLVRVVPRVHPGGRPLVVPAVIDLERRLLGDVHELRRRGPAVAGRRQRQILKHRLRDRIDQVRWNCVVGERHARIREGVVDRDAALREVAVALELGRQLHHCRPHRLRLVAFARSPKERAVVHDRATERPATQIEVRVVFRQAGFLWEEELPLAPLRPVLKQRAAMPVVRSRLAERVEHAAAGAAHLSIVRADLDLYFLDRFDVRDDDRPIPHVGNRDALERVVVAAPRSAAER